MKNKKVCIHIGEINRCDLKTLNSIIEELEGSGYNVTLKEKDSYFVILYNIKNYKNKNKFCLYYRKEKEINSYDYINSCVYIVNDVKDIINILDFYH